MVGQFRRGLDIAERLLSLSVLVLSVVRALPRDVATRHIALQLVKSATSPGANYEEARAAESRADFIHKVRISAKELRETVFWLALIERASLVRSTNMQSVSAAKREASELAAILMTSAKTAAANRA